MKPIILGKINGKLAISDIYYPDADFNCLKKLGEPISIEESHSVAGDDYTFIYEKMTLFFSNVTTDELKLSSIEMFAEGTYFLELEGNKGRLTTGTKLSDQLKDTNIDQFEQQGGTATILFYDYDGSSMNLERKNGKITKITIYFP